MAPKRRSDLDKRLAHGVTGQSFTHPHVPSHDLTIALVLGKRRHHGRRLVTLILKRLSFSGSAPDRLLIPELRAVPSPR